MSGTVRVNVIYPPRKAPLTTNRAIMRKERNTSVFAILGFMGMATVGVAGTVSATTITAEESQG